MCSTRIKLKFKQSPQEVFGRKTYNSVENAQLDIGSISAAVTSFGFAADVIRYTNDVIQT